MTCKIKLIAPTIAGALIVGGVLVASAQVAFAHSGTKEEQEACTPDVFRLCSAEIPDEDRIVACLNRNLAKLSPECRSVMDGTPVKSKSRSNN